MGQLNPGNSAGNVNVTLSPKGQDNPFAGKKFPCCICSASLDIRLSKRGKPYCTCVECGIQLFFRGKPGIRRLTEILKSNSLGKGTAIEAVPAIILYNKIAQLRSQKKELEAKQGLIVRDPDLDNTIRVIKYEMEGLQRELENMTRKTNRENKK
jgi:hypothetical protein